MKTHKDLEVWKNSIKLVTTIYTVTKSYPKEELFGLTNQMRRSAVSIPSNIAEGAARNSKKEFIQFLHIARGNLAELETQSPYHRITLHEQSNLSLSLKHENRH
jgi:four helix bundle protein